MEPTLMDTLKSEWKVLHGDHERYEQFALVIKLFAVAVVLSCWIFAVDAALTVALMLVLWLQEGIWKTFQARITARLLQVETLVREPGANECAAFQLYSAWTTQRKGSVTLLAEYFSNAIRPTVAYPYVALVILTVGVGLFYSVPE